MENLVVPKDRVYANEWDFKKLKTVMSVRLYVDDVQKIDRLLDGRKGPERTRFIRQLLREALSKYEIPNYKM